MIFNELNCKVKFWRGVGEASLEGIVVDSSAKWMRVAVSASTAPHIRGGPWRLDLYADTISNERSALEPVVTTSSIHFAACQSDKNKFEKWDDHSS